MRSLVQIIKPLARKIYTVVELYGNKQNTKKNTERDAKKLAREVSYRKALGFKFNGSDSMERGEFEHDESKIFDAMINHFDLFVNIGANTGYYTLKALYRGKNVLAFEPNELNIKIMLKNMQANIFSADVHLLPIALSNTVGVLRMYGRGTGASLINGWAGQKDYSLVPVNKFDNVASSFVKGKKCLVFIDVEGAELNCLKGGTSLLSSSDDNVLLVEISTIEHQPEGIAINPNLTETFELFFENGYVAYTADSLLREVKIEEVRSVVRGDTDSFGTHNFLFLKNGKRLEDMIASS